MTTLAFGYHSLSVSVVAILLAGCGGSQPSSNALGVRSQSASHGSETFSYTGAEQAFTVPTGVTQVTITARGASGPQGRNYGSCYYRGDNGGRVQATIPVTSGEALAIFVGGEGGMGGACGNGSGGGLGGFNGGGNGGAPGASGGSGNDSGNGGGGASDVRQGGDGLKNRVVVAGGGAGGGVNVGYGAGKGGKGGGIVGGHGNGCYQLSPDGCGGTGGTQSQGGKGGRGGHRQFFNPGARGRRGELGIGGDGGGGTFYSGTGGGGGGGGYDGGGGGGAGSWSTSGVGGGGGGGGGSSYIEPGATYITDRRGGERPGNGEITISW